MVKRALAIGNSRTFIIAISGIWAHFTMRKAVFIKWMGSGGSGSLHGSRGGGDESAGVVLGCGHLSWSGENLGCEEGGHEGEDGG